MAIKADHARILTGMGSGGPEFADVKNGRSVKDMRVFWDAVKAAETDQKVAYHIAAARADGLETDNVLNRDEASHVLETDFFVAGRVRRAVIRKALIVLNNA